MPEAALIDRAVTAAEGAFGLGSPEEQIVYAFLIGIAIIATSSIGLVFTLVLLPIPVALGIIGILRLVPAIDSAWPLSA